jgi:hypothetical protein
MDPKLLISQYFKVPCVILLSLSVLAFAAAPSMQAQTQKSSLPDPVKFVYKYDLVWNVVRAVLDEMEYNTELEDKKAGRITTKPYEFITGSLTSTEVDKVAIKRDTITGNWLKARYTVEALLEIISPTETMVTVRARMEALNRDVDGSEKWIPVESIGTFEKRILGKIALKLNGNDLQFNPKKGFWDKSPQPVDPRRPKP